MSKSTMYITIPKERAARILTNSVNKYMVKDDSDGEILITHSGWGTHRATLTDYELPQARVESSSTNIEAGTLGTKVSYSKEKVYDKLKEYEV